MLKIIQIIEISKAARIDKLSEIFLKDEAKILAELLRGICHSITSRTFANSCKVAKPKHIFKKDKITDSSYYRLISLLRLIFFFFFLKRVWHDQTNELLKENKLSIWILCLSFLTDKILKGLDEGLLTKMILTEILLKKFKAMDFSNGCIAWFQSYLSERILFVSIENNSLSGVKQGSILGLLLFLLYVHDMLQAVNSNLFLHAGDPRLMFQHIDVEEIATVLNNDFENIV